MRFEEALSIISGMLVVILVVIAYYKIFNLKRNLLVKLTLSAITLLLALPFWYLIQDGVNSVLAVTVPQNKIVNCIYLNENNCNKRPDCQLIYIDGGLGTSSNPMCIYR